MTRLLRLFVALLAWAVCADRASAQPPVSEVSPVTGTADARSAPLDNLMTSFILEHKLPGAALAVARGGRLVYARGFGYADLEKKEPVHPDSLFRIASVTKPLTSAAIMQLIDRGKLSLDDHPFVLLGVMSTLKDGQRPDDRLARITVRDLLSHAGGFDRAKSGDPMFMSRRIASDLHIPSPPAPADIIRWVAAHPLDFDPGTKSDYSNFGYCVLGRVVEKVSGQTYEHYVQDQLLRPLGITRMRIGSTLESGRAEGEVRYYTNERDGRPVFDGEPGPVTNPYGSWCLESMDAHGGWIASAPDLVRFGTAVGESGRLLKQESLDRLWARPAYADPKAATYYTLGWSVRPAGSSANTWHNGSLPGTATLLVRRHDGFVWAVLFNSREGDPVGKIDGPIHAAVDAVKEWPEGEPLFTAGPAAPPASGAR